MTEGPEPCRSALGSYPAAAAPIAYSSLTLSVLAPTGIDPSLPDCCPSRYWMALEAGSTCVAALPVPMAKASSAAPVAPVVASAATLLVLPMSIPHAATGTPPLPELSSPHEASSRRARGWRSTPRVGLLACGSMPDTAAFPGDDSPGGTMAAGSPLTVARQRRILTGFPSPGALFSCGRRVCAGSRRIRQGAGGYT